jgi:RNA polymerase sigma factor (sigma-70 family)
MTGPADILRRLEQAGPADRELLARFVGERDQSSFAELVRRHGPVVLGVCRRVTGHPQDAEDAFQAVFLILARKAGAIGNPDLLGNWLYGVAVRVARKARRSAARRRAREVAVSPFPDTPARPVPAFSELGPVLDEELAALPAWYRDAILLCDLRGVSREEAAVLLGVPEGTLSSRLANGRKKLAARLTKRGIALSVAALPALISSAQAGVAVPNELLTRTCGLVADWSASGAVPGPLAKLAEGGFAVRKTLLFGVLMVVAVAGAVVAAGPGDDAPPAEPPKPAAVAKGEPAAEPKAEEKPGEKVAFTTSPKLRRAADLRLASVTGVSWSPDGKSLIVEGPASGTGKGPASGTGKGKGLAPEKGDRLAVILTDVADSDPAKWGRQDYPLARSVTAVGFMPDSRRILTDLREYNLVSGRHELIILEPDTKVSWGYKSQRVQLDATDTHGYAFAADGKTFRTVAHQRDASGATTKLEVQEVDAATGKTLKTLLKIDYEQYVLSPDGKRLATIDNKAGKVTVYDVDRGEKLSVYTLPERPDAPRPGGPVGAPDGFPRDYFQTYTAFSPDGRRLVVSRRIGQSVVLNTDTGEPLPTLDGSDLIRTNPAPHAFTGNGRLLAMAGTRYVARKEQTYYQPASGSLTVWDTQTGKVLKSWDRAATVAFNPARPLLAVLEKNDDDTRLGLWDFAAEVEKK